MIKQSSILFTLLFTTSLFGFSQTTDLLISEYVEGDGVEKYIEIYNGTGANVNLANYQLRLYSNGAAAPSITNTLSGTLANNSVIVYRNSGATIYAGATTIASVVNFNGDDAVELFNTSTGLMVDLIGNIGCDPGSAWSSGSFSTANKTIVRNANICSGVTSDPTNSPCTFPTQATEWTQYTQDDISNLGSHTETCSTPCVALAEPTVSASSLLFPDTTCTSIDLSWTTGNGSNAIVVASTTPIGGTPSDQTVYIANAVFGSGSTIAAGEFIIYNGNGTTTTVTGLSALTTYYFMIIEYNGTTTNCEENYLTSSTLIGNFSTPVCPASVDPEITGILVDACGGSEGVNEFITFTNGNSNLNMNDLKVTFPFISPYCNSGCGANTWVTNPTYTTQLNTTAGCAGLFVEADPIPANANVIIFTGSSPTFAFDFTGLCGSGPYYAVYSNNTGTGGRFGNYDNDCTKFRETIIDFGSSQDTATYQPCLLSPGAADGDYVAFAQDGTPTYSNDGCTPTATLPIELLSFEGKKQVNNTHLLTWVTLSEINNDYFTIERSTNAIDFTPIGTVLGAGNSNLNMYYQLVDDSPNNGINYYRLKQTDFDGDFKYANTIAINNKNNDYNLIISNHYLNVIASQNNTEDRIEVYDVLGQVVYSKKLINNTRINISSFRHGIYIIKVGNSSNQTITKMKF